VSYAEEIRKTIGHDEIIGVGAGIFIYKDRKVLLQKRKDNLCWSMHGGGLEIGETVEDAAKRELFEETGLIANNIQLLGVFSGNDLRYTYPNGDKVSIVEVVYVCNDFSGDVFGKPKHNIDGRRIHIACKLAYHNLFETTSYHFQAYQIHNLSQLLPKRRE
jgi:8-oxo-dGTP pyrophosphatase MutT (NUDIX family)